MGTRPSLGSYGLHLNTVLWRGGCGAGMWEESRAFTVCNAESFPGLSPGNPVPADWQNPLSEVFAYTFLSVFLKKLYRNEIFQEVLLLVWLGGSPLCL